MKATTRHQIVTATIVASLLSGCAKPSDVNNYYGNPQGNVDETSPEKRQARFLESKENNAKLRQLEEIINNGRLTLQTKRFLKELVYHELAVQNKIQVSDVSRFVSSSQGRFLNMSEPGVTEKLSSISKDYSKSRQKIEKDMLILNGTKQGLSLLYDGAAIMAGSSGVGLPAAIGIEAVKTVTIQSLDITFAAFEEDMKKRSDMFLEQKVMDMPAHEQEELKNLATMTEADASRAADQLAARWTEALVPRDLGTQERSKAMSVASHYIARAALAKAAGQSSVDRVQSESIENTKRDIVALSRGLAAFADFNKKALGKIANGQAELKEKLDGLVKDMSSPEGLSGKVDFLTNLAFGQLPIERQVDLLNSRGIHIEGVDKAKLEAKLAQKKMWDGFKDYMAVSGNVLTIAQNLGVNPEVIKKIHEANRLAQTGANIYQSFLSGNTVQAVALASGLFAGSNGFSIEDSRHAEITGKLDSLLEGQGMILKNQKMMVEQLNSVLSGQAKLMTALKSVSEQIEKSTMLLYGQMLNMKEDLEMIGRGVQNVAIKDLDKCRQLDGVLTHQNEKNPLMLISKGKREILNYAEGCASEVNRIFERSLGQETLMVGAGDEVARASALYSQGLYQVAASTVRNLGEMSEATYYMANPTGSAVDVILKAKARESSEDRTLESSDFSELTGLLKTRINTPLLVNVLRPVLRVYPALTVYRNSFDEKALDLDEIIRAATQGDDSSSQFYRRVLIWIKAAIVQESMMSGDYMLSYFDRMMNEIEKGSGQCHGGQGMGVECLLLSNPILRRNFAMYALRRDFDRSDISPTVYGMAAERALREGNADAFKNVKLKNLAGRIIVGQKSGKNVIQLKLGSVVVDLPDYESFLAAKLEISPVMGQLLSLQKELVQLYAEVQLPTAFKSDEDRKAAFELVTH